MRSRSTVIGGFVCVIALASLAGCGSEVDTDERAIEAVLAELRRAQEASDGETACRRVYVVAEAWEKFGNKETGEGEGEGAVAACQAAFAGAVEHRQSEITDLSTSLGEIEVDGNQATAVVHTELQRADGSLLSQDASYDLVRTADGWRVRISDEG